MKEVVKKLICAINGTQNSIHAGMYAIMLAKSCSWQLKFIYVVDSATVRYLGMNQILIKSEENEFMSDLRTEGMANLEYLQALAATKGVTAEIELLEGNVSSEIVSAAEKYSADMIILGGKEKQIQDRYRSSSKQVLSTHRTEILLNAKCPVLMVQKQDIEAQFKIF